MGRGFTPDEFEWVIENYNRLGPAYIAERFQKRCSAVKLYVERRRKAMKEKGDSRWKKLYARRGPGPSELRVTGSQEERIIYYGATKAPPPIEGKYGVCPPWLVVTFPAYQRALIDFPSGGKPGHGGSWMSDKQCSGRDVGAVHQVSMVEVVGHRVGD